MTLCWAYVCPDVALVSFGDHLKQQDTGRGRDAVEGKGPHSRPQRRVDRGSEEVAKAVGGGYCQLQMPWKLALAVRETAAGYKLGALEEGGGGCLPPFQCIPGSGGCGHRVLAIGGAQRFQALCRRFLLLWGRGAQV